MASLNLPVFCLRNASSVRTLLHRLHQRLAPRQIYGLLVHDWDCWYLTFQIETSLRAEISSLIVPLAQEYGFPVEPPPRLARLLHGLAGGEDLVALMERYQMPILLCDAASCEELTVFCDEFSRGLGYQPPSLR